MSESSSTATVPSTSASPSDLRRWANAIINEGAVANGNPERAAFAAWLDYASREDLSGHTGDSTTGEMFVVSRKELHELVHMVLGAPVERDIDSDGMAERAYAAGGR